MAKIKVKNKPGTAGQKPPKPYSDLSWLEFWKVKTGETVYLCGACGCLNKAEHGGHVKKCDESQDSSTYIVPLCAECNNPNNTQEFYVNCELCAI